MPLPTTRYSRFNFRYLATRYAGPFFMLLALGLLAGLAYRLLVQPTRYSSDAEVTVTVTPPEEAGRFDWEAKVQEWRRALLDKREQGLIGVNLRHAVKLAVTEGGGPPGGDLSAALADFTGGKTYSASLFRHRLLWRLGPVVRVHRADLIRNMDFQSLAVIAGDLNPPEGRVTDWGIQHVSEEIRKTAGSGVIAHPGPDDPFFRVFYRLYELLHGQPARSPQVAWRAAVEEVTARLERETLSPGDGRFGRTARRELFREMDAIPVLAANGVYHATGWFSGDDDHLDQSLSWTKYWNGSAILDLISRSGGGAVLGARISAELKPVLYPRDTPVTRVTPLAASVLIDYFAARERHAADTRPIAAAEAEELPPEEPPIETEATHVVELSELPVVEPPEDPAPAEPVYIEMYDEVAAKQQQSLIRMHEEAVKLARVEREAVLRQLNTARAASNRLSHEAITARNRADKLRERYDVMATANEREDSVPKVPPATQELFQRRDELLERLVSLREYCTEEHPFVKLALRDLRVVEGLLADHEPDEVANRDAEERATRLANLYLEWESATSQADSYEERARRHDDDIACLLNEILNLERCISQREFELAQAKEAPVPIIRVPVPAPAPTPPVVVVKKVEVPKPRPVRAVAATTTAQEILPVLEFGKPPPVIDLSARHPDWKPLLWGLLGGLLASLLWMLLRELLGDRFRNVGEAHRLVGLPVLASLPEYDQRSVVLAADSVKGELTRTKPGRLQFTPLPVESVEPPSEGRRGKIRSTRRRSRWVCWALGLLFLLLAGLLYYRSLGGFAPPYPYWHGPLSLPSETVPVWLDETAHWGDLP